jgi:hypothetical protein
MVAHLRAIHEHVLSLLGDINDDGDDGNDEDVDDPDQLEEQSDDEDKALLLELKALAEQARKLTSA